MFWRGAGLALVTSLAMALAPAQAHSPGVADADQAVAHQVEDLREALKRAIERKDAALLRRMYADSFTHIDASGRVERKDARIAAALAGKPMIESAAAEDIYFSVHGGHTIVVTGVSPGPSRMMDGRGASLRWMAVYVKAGADWQLAASQATRRTIRR
jgi:hypothetical protein